MSAHAWNVFCKITNSKYVTVFVRIHIPFNFITEISNSGSCYFENICLGEAKVVMICIFVLFL